MTTKALQNPGTGKYNIADYFGPWSPDALKHIFSKIDYNIDETELKKLGVTKEQYLQHPTTSISISQLLLEISLLGQVENEKITNEKERFTQNKLNFLIARAINKALGDEAMSMFVRREHLKEAMQAYRQYIKAISEENYRRMIEATEKERLEMEEKMKMIYEAEIMDLALNHQEIIHHHEAKIKQHEEKIESLKDDYVNFVEEHKEEYLKAYDDAFAKSPANDLWKALTDQQRLDFVKNVEREELHTSTEIAHLEALKGKCTQDNKEVKSQMDKMRSETEAKIAAQLKSSGNGKFSTFPNQHEIKRLAERELKQNPEYQKLEQTFKKNNDNHSKYDNEQRTLKSDEHKAKTQYQAMEQVAGKEKADEFKAKGGFVNVELGAELKQAKQETHEKVVVEKMGKHESRETIEFRDLKNNRTELFSEKDCGMPIKQITNKSLSW